MMPTPRKMTFDEQALAHLKACKAQGMTLGEAAREFGLNPGTLSTYIHQSPHADEVKQMYPHFGMDKKKRAPDEGFRVIDISALKQRPPRVPETPQSQWLAKSWRAA